MPSTALQNRLRLLYEATALRGGGYRERIAAALQAVAEALGMTIGILSRIDDDRYTVVETYAPDTPLRAGDVFELGSTYCSLTLAAGGVQSIDRMSASRHRRHPCYRAFQLEAYIGAAVTVDGETYGTVNFSSPEPREQGFAEADEELVQLLARWLGVALEAWQRERDLQESEARFRMLTEAAFEAVAVVRDGRVSDVNDAFCELFGTSRDDAVGRLAADFATPADRDLVATRVETGDPRSYEVEVRRADGSSFTAEVRGKTLEFADGPVRVTAIRDITSRKKAEERLRYEALHDPVTGLGNRPAFVDALRNAVARAERYPDYGFALLFLDLDRFKSVNDRFGHHVGDGLLTAFARRLRSCIREVDTAARLGGDEFVVLLDGAADETDAVRAADRILTALSRPFEVGGRVLELSCSIGLTRHDAGPADPEALIRDADAAMYRAKAQGKARVVAFREAMRLETRERLDIESKLARSVHEQSFELHYQPIVALDTGRTVALEALLRWPQPDGSSISPGSFIPVAEETGAIVPLGYWVLDTACRQLRAWQRELGDERLRIHVNLSARQFAHAELVPRVETVLETRGVDPACLALEVTETAIMTDAAEAARIMHRLKALGVRLHVDDFGTGYSSLAYLQRFPIDALKVDRSFVRDMTDSEGSLQIVRTVLSLANNLQLEAIAEGIEDDRHAESLRSLDCPLGQGFLYARPMPADEVLELLRR